MSIWSAAISSTSTYGTCRRPDRRRGTAKYGATPLHSLLLGFDLCQRPERYLEQAWSPERRREFLLRPDIAWPKSVDPMVWPSIFRYDTHPYELGWVAVPDPTDIRHRAHLVWQDYAAMIAAAGAALADSIPVRIDVLCERDPRRTDAWGLAASMRPPQDPHESTWRLLGYDVADSGLISGLSNCGYTGAEREECRRTWSPGLNRDGLFTRQNDANGFRAATDRRIPEHAPFFVFALHALPDGL